VTDPAPSKPPSQPAVDEPTWQRQRTSFGAIADTYDAHRPDWPAPTAAWLTGIEDGGPLAGRTLDVLDLGAGTGKLTRTLAGLGHRVTAVDSSEGMLAVLARELPQVSVVVGRSERIPAPDHSQDVVTVAQAWHWFEQPASALECARVLRPGGLVGVGWHLRDESVEWVAELTRIVGRLGYRSNDGNRHTPESVRLPPVFGPVEEATFPYRRTLTPAQLVGLMASTSYVALNPRRDEVMADVQALGEQVAAPDGTLELPYLTYCYRAALLPE
jgi:SAM-dependent methyltransferase